MNLKPELMSSMMDFLKNPGVADKMKEMMQNPQMLEVLNDPTIMQNVMGMFSGNTKDNKPENEEITDKQESNTKLNEDDKTESEEITDKQESNTKFNENDNIILVNLKSEQYNGKSIRLVTYNEEKERYLVEVDGKQILIKEENLEIVNDSEEATNSEDVNEDIIEIN